MPRKPKKTKDRKFTNEEIDNFIGFALVLKRIHVRLITEGYIIKDGKIYKPETPPENK